MAASATADAVSGARDSALACLPRQSAHESVAVLVATRRARIIIFAPLGTPPNISQSLNDTITYMRASLSLSHRRPYRIIQRPMPTVYKYSEVVYTGDGHTTTWAINFAGGFISPAHIKARLFPSDPSNVPISLVVQSPGAVLIEPAVAARVSFMIYRDTPKPSPRTSLTAPF